MDDSIQTLAGQRSISEAMRFQDAVRAGELTNGWSYRTQIAHLEKGGRACVLVLRKDRAVVPVMVLTIADSTETMNRHLQSVFNHFTHQAR